MFISYHLILSHYNYAKLSIPMKTHFTLFYQHVADCSFSLQNQWDLFHVMKEATILCKSCFSLASKTHTGQSKNRPTWWSIAVLGVWQVSWGTVAPWRCHLMPSSYSNRLSERVWHETEVWDVKMWPTQQASSPARESTGTRTASPPEHTGTLRAGDEVLLLHQPQADIINHCRYHRGFFQERKGSTWREIIQVGDTGQKPCPVPNLPQK